MKLCIDCRHCYVPADVRGFTIFPRPDIATCRRTDLVDGSGRSGILCASERTDHPSDQRCGREGQYHDPDGRGDERRRPRGVFKEMPA